MNETYINLTALTPYGETVSNIDDDNETYTTVIWKFKYSGYPRPQFHWSFKSRKLSIFNANDKELYRDFIKYIIEENVNNKLITLKLLRPFDTDVGEYRLIADNGFKTMTKTFSYVIDSMHFLCPICW